MSSNPINYSFSFLLSLLLLSAPIVSFGQYFDVQPIKGESPYHKQVFFTFPQLANVSDQKAADEINRDLSEDVLKIEPGKQRYSIFENIWGSKEMDLPAVGEMSYVVLNNDADLFCISISATACTETCEPWTHYYIYDSKSGRRVKPEELLTPPGEKALIDSANIYKSQKLKEYTDKLKETLAKQPLSDDDKQSYQSAIDTYNKCMQAPVCPEGQLKCSFDKKRIIIHAERCLPADLRYLDKAKYSFVFNVADCQKYLSDYGRSLLHL
jgi:hypothetical protein